MKTITICIGLDNSFVSPDVAFLDHRENVGEREIGRLLGRGKNFGNGPLPTFLRGVAEGETGRLVVISRKTSEHGAARGLVRADIVDVLRPMVAEAEMVVPGVRGELWGELGAVIRDLTGDEPAELCERDDFRFLVVGTHTENRVLAIASFLRNVLGCREVAVSAHLVGSSSIEAHYAALRHNLPACGVRVLLDLEACAEFAGVPSGPLSEFGCRPCVIQPEEACRSIPPERRRIIESLCMQWTRTQLRPLQGGFSGSLLFVADGWKGEAKTEPVVLKIDQFRQMRREIDGYHQVKDFFGKNVPTFSHTVSSGDSVGVAMEFAAMEGRPETLQDSFEQAEDEASFSHFLRRFEKALTLLVDKLYRNTRRSSWIAPYRAFGLHAEQQQHYLEENLEAVLSYCEELDLPSEAMFASEVMQSMFKVISANEGGVESEVCLVHGDLNYQNIVVDSSDNIWFIDWTHSGEYPLEIDFAKLENDVKFVMSKQFDCADLPRLKQFEEYLLSERVPPAPHELPESFRHVKWDLRYRKILETIRVIREVCFAIKRTDDWLVYQIALLRYATHSLSFDRRRGRGECEVPQLLHAAYSIEALAFNLVSDDFHLSIRGERPDDYPPRQRVSIDYSPWSIKCPDYDPPYYVDQSVLANDPTMVPGGWADPEDLDFSANATRFEDVRDRDDRGRPLNPRGRTGLAGRGLLGRWGANLAAASVVLRVGADKEHVDVLVGQKEQDGKPWLPRGFLREGESAVQGNDRILEAETGWCPASDEVLIHEGFFYDARQTDHAWVEIRAFLKIVDFDDAPHAFHPGGDFEAVRWMPITAGEINRMSSAEARFVQQSIRRLQREGRINESMVEHVLARSG